MIAEDDPDQLMIRAMLFRENGFQVAEADSYDTAMAVAKSRTIRCAVIDLRLPTEVEGLRLIRDLKAKNPNVLVYVLTGSQMRCDKLTDLSFADGVFGKGQPASALLQRIHQLR